MNPLFASDNVTCACPEVMYALIEANSGIADLMVMMNGRQY